MKKERIVLIISLVIMSLSSIVSAMAVSAYLYNSNEVSYNNNASGISSTNVQGAIDELYGHVTDYTSMDTRVSSLEGYFKNNPNINFSNSNGINTINVYTALNKDGGFSVFDNNSKRRGYLYYDSGTDGTYLTTYNSSGEWGKGSLTLSGNPVKINGTNINDYYVVESKNIPVSFNNSDYATASVSIEKTGYTALGVVGIRAADNTTAYICSYYKIFNDNTIGLTVLTRNGNVVTVDKTATVEILYKKN